MNAASIAAAVKGKRAGDGWLISCPSHRDRDPSLLIKDGENGLLVKCFAGCQAADILRELRRADLINETYAPSFQPDDDREQQKRIEQAQRIWRDAIPGEAASVVRAYLASRGFAGAIPATLRFHGFLKHSATGLTMPGMVAAVARWPSNAVTAIHRTFLLADGRGKAPVSPDKMMLGTTHGGAVRLAPVGPRLALAEGIETALSILAATGLPTWACLSAGGMERAVLPEAATEVLICADHDANGVGQRAAERLASRLVKEGRAVRITMPDQPGSDFNDVLRGVA